MEEKNSLFFDLDEASKLLFFLKFNLQLNNLKDHSLIKKMRREIARENCKLVSKKKN
ncbi:MAG: hypothetical protein AM1032_000239 [Mycoplasmataceae bacterium]|nr:MAG: hypothetical protein AM1032_000239 [Mycoplasmataceae bacterium]